MHLLKFRNMGFIAVMATCLITVLAMHCSGPTGGEDNPKLAVTPDSLDFGETNTSHLLTISNVGTGTLHWSIKVPSEGWITIAQREGNITNEPVSVDVRIDRDKAPVGRQEVKLVVTAERGGHKEVTLVAIIHKPPKLSISSPAVIEFGETLEAKSLILKNEGGESLVWHASSNKGWMTVAPDSGTVETGGSGSITITIDRRNMSVGSHDGKVEVTSNGGSGSVTILMRVPSLPAQDTEKPTVSITFPADGATVSGDVTVAVDASDNVGVTGVEFYIDGNKKSTEMTSPYSYIWDTATESIGPHTLSAKAFDAAGNNQISETITVTLQDTEKPTVSITSPTDGATISGEAKVSVDASDNVGVTKVEFYVDGNLKSTDSTSPYSYMWDTATESIGSHSLSAKAFDAAGNNQISGTITVTVPDTEKPTVSIISPAEGATVSGEVKVSVDASDNVGVTKVEFYIDGSLKSTDSTSPYSYIWDTATESIGSHSLSAKAFDAAKNDQTSSPIAVTVANVDLVAEEVSITKAGERIDPNSLVEGDEVELNLRYRNAGTIVAAECRIEVYVDGVLAGSDVRSIEANSSHSAGLTWTATKGTHTVEFRLDTDNLIEEMDETNNTASLIFTVSADPWKDTDGDGYSDSEDLFPHGNAKIQVVLKKFAVFVEDGGWGSASEIYFHVKVDEGDLRVPRGDASWVCDVGEHKEINRSEKIDVADNSRYHTIRIEMWDEDAVGDDLYDIDADQTKNMNLRYDLRSEVWTGDDTDGVTRGKDGSLEYEIKTVVE